MVDHSTGYDDEQDRLDRADEQIREQRWAEFVAEMKDAISNSCLSDVLNDVSSVIFVSDDRVVDRSLEDGEMIIADFAETEGWDGVLCAIARAYREEQDAQKKKADPEVEQAEIDKFDAQNPPF
jgi:hypothetical protein